MIPVSALLISRNEEKQIARALRSLTWCDEIIVVDAMSTDRTPEICQDSTAAWAKKMRFFPREWKGFREQRTFALEQAKNDWVVVLDCDEECSIELQGKLKELLSSAGGPPERAYKLRRQEYFLGKPIYYGVWNPSYQDRFFHKAGVKYVNEIHEYPVFPSPPGRVEEPILHFPHFHPAAFLDKMNRYTSIEARDRVRAGRRTNLARVLLSGPAMFFKNYFYYSAWKDGTHGLVISVLEGISRAVRHIKMWQYSREEEMEKRA